MLLPSTDKNSYDLDICIGPHIPVNYVEKTRMFQQKHTFLSLHLSLSTVHHLLRV
jgi:hypothetical protein